MAEFRVTWKRIDDDKPQAERVFADTFYIEPFGTLTFRSGAAITKAYASGRWLECERVK